MSFFASPQSGFTSMRIHTASRVNFTISGGLLKAFISCTDFLSRVAKAFTADS